MAFLSNTQRFKPLLVPLTGFLITALSLLSPGSVCAGFSGATDGDDSSMAWYEPIVESRCAKLPAPCDRLCQDAASADTRAAVLEETAEVARSKAKMARTRAEYFQDLADRRTLDVQKANRKSYRVVWKTADIILRLFVPKRSRNSHRSEGILNQSNTSTNRKREEKAAEEARVRADEALTAAEEAIEEAYRAASEAMTARIVADEARDYYEACACR